ncbi:DsrE family protein [Limimaricola sp. G21655-S1]|uniref:DsrE family protein n=1 Tax=Limimaricola sp. G21655-S1 TaxID=3014768 RepID=UPI0022AF1D97|nr:DsrE family protein [Limimaricola sp. G21655-S1]MCZ4262522.1 DsrE family protein [Limimaricola sp. G21655-S1]
MTILKRMRGVLAAGLAVLTLLAAGNAAAQDSDRYGQQKVVYHINGNGGEEDKAYRGALRNVQNHINAVGRDNIEVKVVLHGNGVGLLQNAMENEQLQMDVTSLRGQNVVFLVCNNTLTGRDISYEEDLFEVFEDQIVPSGVAELSYLQGQGYTYVKP